MEQLTMNDLYVICKKLKAEGYNLSTLPVYLGDDDELNGIHCGWFCGVVDSESNSKDDKYITEMINECSGNNELKGKGVLIS